MIRILNQTKRVVDSALTIMHALVIYGVLSFNNNKITVLELKCFCIVGDG